MMKFHYYDCVLSDYKIGVSTISMGMKIINRPLLKDGVNWNKAWIESQHILLCHKFNYELIQNELDDRISI